VSQFGDEVSTGSGSDRVTIPPISIIAIGFDPVATAPGTDSIPSTALRKNGKPQRKSI
jgi:hypothetical protein